MRYKLVCHFSLLPCLFCISLCVCLRHICPLSVSSFVRRICVVVAQRHIIGQQRFSFAPTSAGFLRSDDVLAFLILIFYLFIWDMSLQLMMETFFISRATNLFMRLSLNFFPCFSFGKIISLFFNVLFFISTWTKYPFQFFRENSAYLKHFRFFHSPVKWNSTLSANTYFRVLIYHLSLFFFSR